MSEDPRPADPLAGGAADPLADRAFGFLRIPARPAKPRATGQTIVADKGLGPRQVEDLLAIGADFVDWAKLAGSTARLYPRALLAEKIARYAAADVAVLLAGDVFELAPNQGVADRVYEEAAALGCRGVEVAAAQTIVSLAGRCALVRRAAAHGLQVVAEVGAKGRADRAPHTGWLARQADELLAAGADRVLVQGEGIVEGVAEVREDVLYDLAARGDPRRMVFQGKDRRAAAWLIAHLGPEVNLDVDAHQLLEVELCRRGLRERGLFGLVTGADTGADATEGG